MTCSTCPGSRVHIANVGCKRDTKFDILSDQAVEHCGHGLDDLVDVENLELWHLFSAEYEKLPGEGRSTISGSHDMLGICLQGIALGQIHLCEFGVTDDHVQQIIEIVCDTAGKLADCLHLLGLAQLLFQLGAPGDVAIAKYVSDGRAR